MSVAFVEEKGPLPVDLASDYARQVALGLQNAFESGMVHRDVKPQNLMVTTKGQVKILDFGLAGFVSDDGLQTEFGSIGKAALELTSTVVDDRRVKFIFRVRNFGTDLSPITAWIEKNGVLKRKIMELGLGMGTWDQTSVTWPPRLENGVAIFEIVLTRQ